MGIKFPNLPAYTGFMKPGRFEADIFEMEVDGELPTDINGTFYRVGPDPFMPPRLGKDIAFNGDGIMSYFRFDNGHVDFKIRYARTEKYMLERAARKGLFGAYRNPFTDDPTVAGQIRGTANTGIMMHAGVLYAYKEDSPPLAVDPNTLETIGYHLYGGKLHSKTFTAHPRIDPRTGEMLAFGFASKGEATRDMAYYEISAKGEITHEVWFEAPYSCMVHDFIATEHYVAFPITPVASDLERLKQGGVHFMWDDTKDVFIGVLPRGGTADQLRWFRGPCRFAGHLLNGYEVGDKIIIDAPIADGNVFPFFPDVHGKPFDPQKGMCTMRRWTLDLSQPGDSYTEHQLAEPMGEFPVMDYRYETLRHRYGFMLVQDPTKPFIGEKIVFNTVARIDCDTGQSDLYYAGDNCIFQEPVFIPRAAQGRESDGYIALLINRLNENLTDLLILDAERLTEGPVATVKLPFWLRPGLHGYWAQKNANW